MSQVAFTSPVAIVTGAAAGQSVTNVITEIANKSNDLMFQDYLFGTSITAVSGNWGVRVLARVGASSSAVFAPVGITAFATTGFTPLAALFGATVMQGIPRPFAVEWCPANISGQSVSITGALIGVLHNPG